MMCSIWVEGMYMEEVAKLRLGVVVLILRNFQEIYMSTNQRYCIQKKELLP